MPQHLNPARIVRTGIAGLDDVLLGGVPDGNVILLSGASGTGKTTLALEYVYRGAAELGEPGLVVSFEVAPQKLKRDAGGFGWDLESLEAAGLVRLVHTAPSVLLTELQSHDGVLTTEIQRMGARRVVIDSLAPLRLFGETLGGRPFREILHLLIESLQRHGVTPVLIAERDEPGARPEPYLCDTVIALRRETRGRGVRRTLEVVKSRGQDFLPGRHPLQLEPGHGARILPQTAATGRARARAIELALPLLEPLSTAGASVRPRRSAIDG